MPTCCAPNFKNSRKSYGNVTFHELPWKRKTIMTQWKRNMNLKHDPKPQSRICSEHFCPDDFDPKHLIAPHLYRYTDLKHDAVPTVFTHKDLQEEKNGILELRASGKRRPKRKRLEHVQVSDKQVSAQYTSHSPMVAQYTQARGAARTVLVICPIHCSQIKNGFVKFLI